jgi:uncharacterized Zn finger protein
VAETKQQKAERYLTTGRLTILSVGTTRTAVLANVKGDSGEVYALGYDLNDNAWRCTCEANAKYHRECSHLVALKLVTVRPKEAA